MHEVIMLRSQYPDARLEKEAHTLINNGYKVTLLVWDKGRKIEQLHSNSNYDNLIIKKIKLNAELGSLKVPFFLLIYWLFIIYELLKSRYDIIHASDFDTYLPALFISKVRRMPIVYDIFDFYSDMIDFPVFANMMRVTIGNLDRFLMRFANAIIIVDDSRLKQIGIESNENVTSIYNSPMYKLVDGKKAGQSKSNANFTIFYGGTVVAERNIDKMILAVKDLNDVELEVMGPCPKSYGEYLIDLARGHANINLFFQMVPHEDILIHTSEADVLFAIYSTEIKNNIYSSPNKLFEAMMFGKPIIVNDGTSMANIVREECCGIIIKDGNVSEIQNAIFKLKRDIKLRRKLGDNGQKAYDLKYNWHIMEKRLLRIYKGIIDDEGKCHRSRAL